MKAGAHHILDNEPTTVMIDVQTVKIHEDFVYSSTYVNDIALLHLVRPFLFTGRIQPIALPSYRNRRLKDMDDVVGIVAGWGMVSDRQPEISETLKWAEVRTIPELDCNRWWLGKIFKTNLCTTKTNGKSPCDGDDGGPFMIMQDNDIVQVGIASFGYVAGCETGHPYVYTKLTEYLSWIEQNSDVQIRP